MYSELGHLSMCMVGKEKDEHLYKQGLTILLHLMTLAYLNESAFSKRFMALNLVGQNDMFSTLKKGV